MSAPPLSRLTGRTVAGAILIVLGVVFILDNFGVIAAGDIFQYWPLVLVGIGLLKISQARYTEQRVAGGVILALGVVLLLRSLDLISFHIRDVWPVLFLFAGAMLVWQSLRRRDQREVSERVLGSARENLADSRGRSGSAGAPGSTGAMGSTLNEFALLGGGDRIVRSQEFRGGEVSVIMGGLNIDLRGAAIAGDEAVIEVFALWGGVEIRVPEDWAVVLRGVPILGGFSESSKSAAAGPAGAIPGKTLVVNGTAIMGGVEVKR